VDITKSSIGLTRSVLRAACYLSLALIFGISAVQTSQSAEEDISSETCLDCHDETAHSNLSDSKLDKGGILELSVHSDASCIDCHSSITELPHDDALPPVDCGSCHDEQADEYIQHGAGAVGVNKRIPTCASCHGTHDIRPVSIDDSTTETPRDSNVKGDSLLATKLELSTKYSLEVESCAKCHSKEFKSYSKEGIHGRLATKGNSNAPTCVNCHGAHSIRSHLDSLSLTSNKNLPQTCSQCHNTQTLKGSPDIKIIDVYDRYMLGVHSKSIVHDGEPAAICTDCHGAHDIRRPTDPLSKVYKENVPGTCSTCHKGIYAQYERGIHGKALVAGVSDSPGCVDCHGEHKILKVDDPTSPVNPSNLSDYVCGRCHNDPRMPQKYGLSAKRFTSYQDSYHGLAVKGGSLKAANCVSCHNAHEILPESDSASSINIANRTTTCRKCHPKANATFAASYTHTLENPKQMRINNIVRTIYIILIALVISAMALHNLIILMRYLIEKKRRLKGLTSVSRFNGNMIFQHILLLVSFTVLAVTGFALRYPNEWWVNALSSLGLYETTRSVIHRSAAVVLVYISLHHVVFILFSNRGHRELHSFLPRLRDFTDVFANLRFYLGLSKEKPPFKKYDYTQKAEYWAVVWGTVVMAATGIILWFPTYFTKFLPAWAVTIAQTIHLYEAWLATLAIAVFHFFFVIFHPEQYPMSLTWLTGTMPAQEAEEDHPLWYKEIQEQKESTETDKSNSKEETTDK